MFIGGIFFLDGVLEIRGVCGFEMGDFEYWLWMGVGVGRIGFGLRVLEGWFEGLGMMCWGRRGCRFFLVLFVLEGCFFFLVVGKGGGGEVIGFCLCLFEGWGVMVIGVGVIVRIEVW